jgi:hypothetical protein
MEFGSRNVEVGILNSEVGMRKWGFKNMGHGAEDGYQMLAPPPAWKTASLIGKKTLKKRILNKDELK